MKGFPPCPMPDLPNPCPKVASVEVPTACCKFYKNPVQTILMESQQAMDPGFDISVSAPKYIHHRQHRSF
jgi:hypothetical protein